jgi:hypothetical protein
LSPSHFFRRPYSKSILIPVLRALFGALGFRPAVAGWAVFFPVVSNERSLAVSAQARFDLTGAAECSGQLAALAVMPP